MIAYFNESKKLHNEIWEFISDNTPTDNKELEEHFFEFCQAVVGLDNTEAYRELYYPEAVKYADVNWVRVLKQLQDLWNNKMEIITRINTLYKYM